MVTEKFCILLLVVVVIWLYTCEKYHRMIKTYKKVNACRKGYSELICSLVSYTIPISGFDNALQLCKMTSLEENTWWAYGTSLHYFCILWIYNYLKVKRFFKGSNWSSRDKNSMSLIKHALDRINSRLDTPKEKLNELKT